MTSQFTVVELREKLSWLQERQRRSFQGWVFQYAW